jgi:hypothetical protein
MLVAKSELAFCSDAQQLTKPGFAELFGVTNAYRKRLGSKPPTSPPASTVVSPAAIWKMTDDL